MTFLEAAKTVLAQVGKPLRVREITRIALEQGLLNSKGATPEATMRAQLGAALKREGDKAEIIRAARGLWSLREWGTPQPQERDHGVPRPKCEERPRIIQDPEGVSRRGCGRTWGKEVESILADA